MADNNNNETTPTVSESPRPKGWAISNKLKTQLVIGGLGFLALVVMFTTSSPKRGKAGAAATSGVTSFPAKSPIDQDTPKEVNRSINAQLMVIAQEAKQRAAREGGSPSEKMAEMLGFKKQGPTREQLQQQPMTHTSGYGSSGSQIDPRAEARVAKAEATKREAAELRASNVALSFREKYEQQESRASSAGRDEPEPQRPVLRRAEAPESNGAPAEAASDGKTHTLDAGTVFDTVLINELNAAYEGPVVTMVSSDVYSADLSKVVIKAGSKVIGEARQISAAGQERIAVAFSRLIRTDHASVDLKMPGLSQEGSAGIRDKVNHHYLRTFGLSAALGAIAGFSLLNTRSGYGGYGDYSGVDAYRQGFSQSMGMYGMQTFSRFLNMPWTVTIRPGTLVQIILTADIKVPEYEE